MSKSKDEKPEPGGGMILPPKPNGAVANRKVVDWADRMLTLPSKNTPVLACPTNLDISTFEGKALLLKAGSPADVEVKGDNPLHFVATAFAVIPDQTVDEESGEISEYARFVFYDPEGRTFRTTAVAAPFKLAGMLQLFTASEWLTGIPLVIKARVSKRGRVYHDINVDTSTRYGL